MSQKLLGVEVATKSEVDSKSTVSVSASGSATDIVNYITVDGDQKKLAGADSALYEHTICFAIEGRGGRMYFAFTDGNPDTYMLEYKIANALYSLGYDSDYHALPATGSGSGGSGELYLAVYGSGSGSDAYVAWRNATEYWHERSWNPDLIVDHVRRIR